MSRELRAVPVVVNASGELVDTEMYVGFADGRLIAIAQGASGYGQDVLLTIGDVEIAINRRHIEGFIQALRSTVRAFDAADVRALIRKRGGNVRAGR